MKGFRTKLAFLDVPSENKKLIQSVMARQVFQHPARFMSVQAKTFFLLAHTVDLV